MAQVAKDLPQEDALVRMQRDLQRALKKNPQEIKWGMVIDIAKCIGCQACTIPGVGVADSSVCIACRYCLVACPYAARTSDFGEWYTAETADLPGKLYGRKAAANGYEAHPAAEYGQKWPDRDHDSPVGNARKCHFCLHRLKVGLLPACTTTCIGRATIFGDRTDPQSLVYEMIGSPRGE